MVSEDTGVPSATVGQDLHVSSQGEVQRKVLVTGGAGYIGSVTVRALIEAGYEPIVLDSLVQGQASFVTDVPFYQGDSADAILLDRIMSDHPTICTLIHFAARVDVEESVGQPDLYYSENTCKSLALARHAIERGISNFVFSSTAALYSASQGTEGISESGELDLLSPYAASKWMFERMLQDLTAQTRMRALVLRYFNPIGADPRMRCGPYKSEPTHLLGRLTMAMQRPKTVFSIFGNDYPTRDGTPMRDFVHVWDLARAHVLALKYLHADHSNNFEIINLGSGQGVTVREFVDAFIQVSGAALPVTIGNRRPGDSAGAYANINKARQLLGWRPEYTIEQGIKDALSWETRRLESQKA